MWWLKTQICYKKNVYGAVTSKASEVQNGYCSICNRKKSMTVSDNKIQTESLSSLFKSLGRISAKAGKKLATNVLKNPSRASEASANIDTAAVTKSPKAVKSSLPEVIGFYRTAKGLYLSRFAWFYTI